ncbi:MAG: 2-oxoglutarate dehydrogenase complex dihydrolipoyllysine-residue succinyltransferase, partial [Deltaproteobacteria bacterium]|nr:2-oxoglutarate dehydrogenase complex dihydrolipoyllysine-residue succinyltransferase [Deltaproteobacteria bacterium]
TLLAQWYKQDGDVVQKDEPLFLIETDKVTLEVLAEAEGILKIMVSEGETIAVGAVVGIIDTGAKLPAERVSAAEKEAVQIPSRKPPEEPTPGPAPGPIPAEGLEISSQPPLSPAVRRLVAEKNIDISRIIGTGPGGRITKGDVLLYLEGAEISQLEQTRDIKTKPAAQEAISIPEPVERKPMSPIRQRIASRLLESIQKTAMLTTFNEIDMSNVQKFRADFKHTFQQRYGTSLGLMSFFIKAAVAALKEFPEINAFIEGQDIVYHHYYHIGVAVGTERGLVVPVIRHADRLSFAELEATIIEYVNKIKENRLELADLEGGTFTITNGGVFGSLLSTPILNMPQSGILGMHKIEDRPIAIDGRVVIRPMMYVALSYDHRIVDGREAVTFLKRIKECIESPERMLVEI